MMFPGQGSQKPGMGKAAADANPSAAALFEEADRILERPISRLCFEGPEEELRQTIHTQPALFVTEAALLEVLREEGFEPSIVAGHSLGEYTALYAAGVFDFETGLRLVDQRARLMDEAGRAQPGAMAAILKLDRDRALGICKRASVKGVIVAANWNSPEQVVVSGEPEAVDEAVRLAKEAGSRRSQRLAVSGAFHSPLVQSACDRMRPILDRAPMRPPSCTFVANVSARAVEDVATIRQNLGDQIVQCVLWIESVQAMARHGAEVFVEVGPGKVLTGLLRRIDPELKGVHVSVPDEVATVRETLETSARQQ